MKVMLWNTKFRNLNIYNSKEIVLEKLHTVLWCKKKIIGILALGMLLSLGGNCVAADYVSIKIFPEHVGVFTADGEQQFVAFGYDAAGKATNITKEVGWVVSGENSENLVTINENGLATIVGSATFGQVKISATFPKSGKNIVPSNYLLLN
jgi:hypothetical protein